MKLMKGGLLIILIVGFIFESSVGHVQVVATSNNESIYDAFWDILNREAELVSILNETGNKSVAMELIENSRLGSQNAVNISVLVWKALEELQESGVKMYYSSGELREMAENISENGLPSETIQYLKSRGWSDDEINELEEYIVENADNITSGFNMSAFLQNFSLAFVRVGLKYVHYEGWGVYRAFWTNEKSLTPSANYTTSINPFLSKEWVDFYSAYTSGNVEKEISSADALLSKIESLIKSNGGVWASQELTTGSDGKPSILTLRRNVTSITHIQNGGLLIRSVYFTSSRGTLRVITEDCYWWKALESYRTLREIQVIIEAMRGGVSDQNLQYMLNQRVSQLKADLVVECVKTSRQFTFHKPIPNPIPIPKPWPIEVKSLPRGERTSSISTRVATPIEVTALSPESNYGYIDNLEVTLEKSLLDNGQLEYHLHVSFSVEKNSLSGVTIQILDSQGSDSVSYSTLPVGSQSWDSKSFTTSGKIVKPGDSVTISGTVTITYTATDTPTPTSVNPDLGIAGGPKKGVISTSYSFTVTYDDLMQASKVHVQVVPEPSSSIAKGQSVTFQLVITNNNQVPIYGHWDVGIEIPSAGSEVPVTEHFSDDVTVSPGNTKTVTMTTVTYESAGDYTYSVTFSFGGNTKSASGTIHVAPGSSSSGSLSIEKVDVTPAFPKVGDRVTFKVKVRNSYSVKKNIKVKLLVDGKLADAKEEMISGASDGTFTLYWPAVAGEHSYVVKLYRVDGQELFEDSWSGDFRVLGGNDSGGLSNSSGGVTIDSFECTPRGVGLYEWSLDQDRVLCTVVIQNTGSEIRIAPRVVIDDIETFWLNIRTLPINSSINLQYEVKFSDGLARIMYGPSATALSFVRTVEESSGTVCQRGVCYNSTRIYYLPKNHMISLRLYKAMNFVPTTEVLIQSEKEVITVKYDGYVEKEYTKYLVSVSMFAITSLSGTGLAIAVFGELATTTIGGTLLGGLIGEIVSFSLNKLLDDNSPGGDVG